MASMKSVVAACAALAVAGCATHQATPTHRMTVEIVGAESADCISPQAVGEYAITAPGDFIVEPEAPNVEVICNAEGYQETYASFQEVYNDGSAGAIALGALAFGIMGAAITAGSDGLDSLPNRVTITMVPEGEIHTGSLAQGEYEKASETVIATASLAPAYTAAEPPEDSEIAMARAKAVASGSQVAAAQARDAELRQFETRLKGSEERLVQLLDDYNKQVEFSKRWQRALTIRDIASLQVLDVREDGYVVRVTGNSSAATSWQSEVYDDFFLLDDRRGGLRILAHGRNLAPSPSKLAQAGDTKLRQFETKLRGSKPQLVRLLDDYNRKSEFASSQHPGGPLPIKDVSRITVVDARTDGYVVRLVGNAGVSTTWSADVYNEHFLIDDSQGGLRILAHGQQLIEGRQSFQTAALPGSEDTADLERFEARLRGIRPQLTAMLNDYNRESEFAMGGARLLKIKDVSRVEVVTARPEGYVVRIVGNSGLNATWAADVYDELFLIDNRRGGLRIIGHGKQLAERQARATG